MAYFEQDFDEYKIIHWSNYDDEVARVNCYLSGGLVGILYFMEGDNHEYKPRRGQRVIHLNFPISQLHDIILTLRYEKPLFLFFNNNGPTPFGGLKTSAHEPVGEEES